MDTVITDPLQNSVIKSSTAARMLVHAGPGTGKTQVSAMRLAHLIKSGVRPAGILVLSFSRSAVKTLSRRIEKINPDDDQVLEELRHLSIRTFDSWTFRLLRQAGVAPQELLSRTYDENIAGLAAMMMGPEREEIRPLLTGIRHVIIDEFQDLPGVRGRLVLALLALIAPPRGEGAGFTVLGDPAQAIYGFAARQEDSQDAVADYWKVLRDAYGSSLQEIELMQNYRAVPELADITGKLRQVLRQSASGERKLASMHEFISALPASTEPLSSAWLDCVPEGSVAILTRTNGEAIRVSQKLLGSSVEGPSVPVSLRLANQTDPVPGWVAALLSRFPWDVLPKTQFGKIHSHCAAELGALGIAEISLPSVEVAWVRLMRAAGIPDSATSLTISELRDRLHWPDAFPDDQIPMDASICITTVHQAKGMEFDSVALLGTLMQEADEETGHPEEEASVRFVAVTRAGTHLGVIPARDIFRPPVQRMFGRNGRKRLCHWRNPWVNLEMGGTADLDLCSFVDEQVHGSTDAVIAFQTMLIHRAAELRGHKVLLCKTKAHHDPGHAVYNIHLQNGDEPGMLLGQMSARLTQDLLGLLWNKGFSLPNKIMNLRIGHVVTMAGPEEIRQSVPAPFRLSRLWAGVTLSGTGDFMPWKRSKG